MSSLKSKGDGALSHEPERKRQKRDTESSSSLEAAKPPISTEFSDRQEELTDALQEKEHKQDLISAIEAKYLADMNAAKQELRAANSRIEKARSSIRAAGEATTMSSPNKRRKTAISASHDDRQAQLAAALEDEGRLQAQLEATQRAQAKAHSRTEEARKKIREAGEAEYDSLLFVEKDSLSHMLTFLDLKSLGRCEKTCKPLKAAATQAWSLYEKRIAPQNRSKVSTDVRTRALRFHLASEYAKQVEPRIKQHNAEHYCGISEYGRTDENFGYDSAKRYCRHFNPHDESGYEYEYDSSSSDEETENLRRCRPCSFPDALNTSVFEDPSMYELFIRICSREGGGVVFEGFIPSSRVEVEPREVRPRDRDGGTTPTLAIDLLGLEFPQWPEMEHCLSLDIEKDKEEWQDVSRNIFQRMSMVIIVVEKGKCLGSPCGLKPGLLAAFNGFFENMDEVDSDDNPLPPFDYDEVRYHFRVEAIMPSCPHKDNTRSDGCRFMWFAWNKQLRTKPFAGLLLEDGAFPEWVWNYY